MTHESELREKYSELLRGFLESRDEQCLYDIENISKEFVRANIGPDYILEAHLNTLNEIISETPIDKAVQVYNNASEPIFNLMVAYATAYHDYIAMNEERYLREKQLADELNDANRNQEMFISIMSHDIRSPLSAVVGYSGLIQKRSKDNEKIKRFAEKIENTAMEIDRMIESIRTYSRVKKGISEENFDEIDLKTTLSEIFEFLDEKIQVHGTKIEKRYRTDREYMTLGTEFLKNAYLNIIDNAIKYSPKNSMISITLDDADSEWKFGVADHGDGVPDEMKEAVFERFTRNDTRGIKGSGIGLAITKHAIESHGGKVWIEDNPGGGCIFYITVPKA